MNRDLQELIRKYATEAHASVGAFLHGKSKDNLIGILMDLLTNYFTDKNSSTLREHVMVSLCGYQARREKIGYNGYRQNAISGETEHCEAKPVNIDTNAEKPRKLNGGGNFTDYTWARFEQHVADAPEMIVGGFVDGKLLYVLRFPFNTPQFADRLKMQLRRKFPKGDVPGDYVRGASFTFKHYEGAHVSAAFVADKLTLAECEKHITRDLFAYLKQHAGN